MKSSLRLVASAELWHHRMAWNPHGDLYTAVHTSPLRFPLRPALRWESTRSAHCHGSDWTFSLWAEAGRKSERNKKYGHWYVKITQIGFVTRGHYPGGLANVQQRRNDTRKSPCHFIWLYEFFDAGNSMRKRIPSSFGICGEELLYAHTSSSPNSPPNEKQNRNQTPKQLHGLY